MKTIADGHVVEMHYSLTHEKEDLIDSSKDRGPLAYIQGNMERIPGLEKEMAGKKTGDKFKMKVAPEEAYGVKNETMIQAVPKSQFGPQASEIKVGMQFEVSSPEGQNFVVTAVEIKEDEVVLDGNHPLAGETLYFDLEIVSVHEASQDELTGGAAQAESCGDPTCC